MAHNQGIVRRARVTRLDDGSCEIEGVAYIAEQENVNGIIYPMEGLKEVFAINKQQHDECRRTEGRRHGS